MMIHDESPPLQDVTVAFQGTMPSKCHPRPRYGVGFIDFPFGACVLPFGHEPFRPTSRLRNRLHPLAGFSTTTCPQGCDPHRTVAPGCGVCAKVPRAGALGAFAGGAARDLGGGHGLHGGRVGTVEFWCLFFSRNQCFTMSCQGFCILFGV